jgi:hypothetical protein
MTLNVRKRFALRCRNPQSTCSTDRVEITQRSGYIFDDARHRLGSFMIGGDAVGDGDAADAEGGSVMSATMLPVAW